MDEGRILSLLSSGKDFCEARIERTGFSRVRFKDGEFMANSGSEEGACVRVFKNGCWGFASGSPGEMEGLLKEAHKLAAAGAGRLKCGRRSRGKARRENPGKGAGAQALAEMCGEMGKAIEGKRITNRAVQLFEERDSREYYNSEGAAVKEDASMLYGRFSAVGRLGGRIEEGGERYGSLKGWDEGRMYECAAEAGRKCEASLDAVSARKGEFTAVLDGVLAGVFAHEAVGHACEADGIIEGNSILKDRMGRKIGSPLVNIWDDPGLGGGFGRYSFDDEGAAGRKVELIREGVVCGRLHTQETAAELGEEPNGHGRAESYACSPVVRMSNTCIEPGGQETGELMDVRSGLYLRGMSGGSVDPFTGQFMFRCEEAFTIKNGEAQERVRPCAITGTILDTLLEVDAVGKDFELSPGFCGKEGQSARVSDGGPHVRLNKVRVG